jgi:hypothetical protein
VGRARSGHSSVRPRRRTAHSSADITAVHRFRSTGNQVRINIPVKTWRWTRCARNFRQQVWATQSLWCVADVWHQALGERPVCHRCAHRSMTVTFMRSTSRSRFYSPMWSTQWTSPRWSCGAVARDHGRAGLPRGGGVRRGLRARSASLPVTRSCRCSAPGRRSAVALDGLGALCQ